ncbi:exo-alpha-sialidase [Paraburkholderia sp. Tr-20389]|uniref:sialidase family protein n=1 Tax=Paraburkholderia sp. Tr-20389 TaxID=2703903 RepID=UPI0019803C04|nr:sialidase family protein [Paraburkholderia sp. Tr-20389]MBN3756913.1 exo-alpha-sialidase [Paraburkholderia sp. Tr-20389]
MGIAVTCAILVTSTQSAVADVTPPGVVIAHSFARTGVYLGSPAIAILPDGAYVVAHDTFGPGSRQNTESLYESRDEGRSWKKLVDVNGQYWSSLFVDHGLLYIVGTSGFSGLPCIRRSADGGRSWSVPRDIGTGMLSNEGKYFSAAVPVVVGNGRIWRSMESVEPTGIWSFMMSAPIDSNLLDGRNWKFTNRLRPNAEWLNGRFRGWLEGNAVVTSHDAVVNVLRVYFNDLPEKVALVSVSPDGTKATFDPESGFADMPGGGKKFTIRFDSRSGLYWSLTNSVDAGYGGSNYERARNTLALVASRDLRNWSIRRVVLHHNDWSNHGFQYADWQFDGNDIVAVVRTSFDDGDAGAHSQHDSNYITFNRIANFRDIGIEN